jgi:hypothetical protein
MRDIHVFPESGSMQGPDIIAGLGRQIDRKDRSDTLFAVDSHCAAVALHQMFNDGKTKTGAANGPRPRCIHSVKPFGQARQMFACDPV